MEYNQLQLERSQAYLATMHGKIGPDNPRGRKRGITCKIVGHRFGFLKSSQQKKGLSCGALCPDTNAIFPRHCRPLQSRRYYFRASFAISFSYWVSQTSSWHRRRAQTGVKVGRGCVHCVLSSRYIWKHWLSKVEQGYWLACQVCGTSLSLYKFDHWLYYYKGQCQLHFVHMPTFAIFLVIFSV